MIELMGDWRRLGRLVVAARVQRGWDTAAAWSRDIGVSDQTLRYIETAAKPGYNPGTLAKVEASLGWAPGSIDAVLDGGNPTPLPPLEPQPDIIVQDVEGALGVQVAHVAGQLTPKALSAFLAELRAMGIIGDDEEI